jgi:putative ABC transport system permease protein
MIWTTILMAFREIRRNPMRSSLTMLGIVIGVASVIIMVALGRGAAAKITADIAGMGTNLLIASPGSEHKGPTASAAQPFKQADAQEVVRELASIADVAPAASLGVLLVNGNLNWSSTVTGSTNAYFQIRAFTFDLGEGFSDTQLQGGAAVCILGATVRTKLFGSQDPMGSSIRIAKLNCTVVGVTHPKGQSSFGMDQDDFVLVPLATFQRRITGSTDVGVLFLGAHDGKQIQKVKDQVTALLRERRRIVPGAAPDFNVQSMQELTATLATVTNALIALLGAIAAVSLVVGGIGIMNIMLVSVTERTREIGIRLSIGARAREVLFQFLVEAMALSGLGGILGILLGELVSYLAARLMHLPFSLVLDMVVISFLFSVSVGVAFGYLPARKASRLNPIEALRHE